MGVTKAIATVAILALAGFGALGCGSSKSSNGSVAKAKQALVADCHKGHESDAADLKQCQCIVARLESKSGYKKAEQFDTLRQQVNKKGDAIPPELAAAGGACPKGK